MKRLIGLLLIVNILLVAGCKENGIERKEIERKSAIVVKSYWKNEKKNFRVTGYQYPDESTGVVFVEGYLKEDRDNKMFVTVHYLDDYSVGGYGEGVEEE